MQEGHVFLCMICKKITLLTNLEQWGRSMKIIILAAGQGTRLRPYTNDRPKCMVELAGKPLLHHQLTVIEGAGFSLDNIALVGGYLKERLNAPGTHLYENSHYATTNMVSTLFCAEQFMSPGEDLLICYGDIVYEPKVLEKLLETEGEVVIAADREAPVGAENG